MNTQSTSFLDIRLAWLLAAVSAGAIGISSIARGAQPTKPLKPRVLVDFQDADAVKLHRSQAKAVRLATGAGHGLQITTEASAAYPSVTIEPREGKWDLTGYDAVEMDVSNPQDASVRVLLSINNPGADGRNKCNTESVTVVPRGKAVLTVPFGVWHGDPGHPLDLKNIVSLAVLLDRPGRAHTFVVRNIRVVSDRGKVEEVLADPFFKQLKPAFGRGINLGNALEAAPNEGSWGVTLKASYFDAIQKAGLDSVRIPVRWSAHAGNSAPFRIDPKFLDRVDWAVRQTLRCKLIPVLNMHHYEEIFNDPDGHRERFIALWRQIAEHFKDFPPELAFELLNEPHAKLTADKWNSIAAEALAVVRKSNPTRLVVIVPVGWNGIGELPSLELPKDQHLVVTVHYYHPMRFTHQGADWAGAEARSWLGTKWTGTKEEQQAVRRDLDKAIAWAVKHRVPIYLGEFGAYNKADMESRARWTRFVAQESLKRKMGFAYWEFCSGFGAYDPQREQWIEPLKDALVKWIK